MTRTDGDLRQESTTPVYEPPRLVVLGGAAATTRGSGHGHASDGVGFVHGAPFQASG